MVPHRADVLVGHAVYPAIGRYPSGASDNAGLGMWTLELSAGTTVYFTRKKRAGLPEDYDPFVACSTAVNAPSWRPSDAQ